MEKLICPVKLEKLLVCTDGSPDSVGAIKAALALAQACNSKVYLLKVLEEIPLDPEHAAWPAILAQKEQQALTHLTAWKAEAVKLNVDLETRTVRHEAPEAAIIEEATTYSPV